MEKFVEEAEKEGISRQVILDMIKRDIAEKEKNNKLVQWIKIRQITTLIIEAVLIIGQVWILTKIVDNLNAIHSILDALLKGFNILKN